MILNDISQLEWTRRNLPPPSSPTPAPNCQLPDLCAGARHVYHGDADGDCEPGMECIEDVDVIAVFGTDTSDALNDIADVLAEHSVARAVYPTATAGVLGSQPTSPQGPNNPNPPDLTQNSHTDVAMLQSDIDKLYWPDTHKEVFYNGQPGYRSRSVFDTALCKPPATRVKSSWFEHSILLTPKPENQPRNSRVKSLP